MACAREIAAELVGKALAGRHPFGFEEMDLPLEALSGPDRRLATELVLGTLRRLTALDQAAAPFLRRPPARMDPLLINVLRTAAYQLLYLDRIPDYAVVSESVRIARRRFGPKAAGFLNAVLRKVSALRGSALTPAGVENLAARHSHPEWLVERWLRHWPAKTVAAWLERSNRPPAVHVTVWTPKVDPAGFCERVRALGGEPVRVFPAEVGAAELAPPVFEITASLARSAAPQPSGGEAPLAVNPHEIARILAEEGLCHLQDAGAALVGFSLPARGYRRVLDLCAAPGGKTLVLTARFPTAAVTATDLSPQRLAALVRRCRGLGATRAFPVAADALHPPFPPGSFDLVLVDAPCSGTGTLQRNPDLRWKLQPERIARMARLQGECLAAAAALVAPGGVLAYATCSAEPEENDAVADRFLTSQQGRCKLLPPPAWCRPWTTPTGYLSTFPHAAAGEGFFCATFEMTGGTTP